MPDARVVLDDGGQILRAMDHDVVLDVGSIPDADAAVVAAQHRTKPDARAGAHLDIADEHGRRRDVCVGMHFRAVAVVLLEFQGPL